MVIPSFFHFSIWWNSHGMEAGHCSGTGCRSAHLLSFSKDAATSKKQISCCPCLCVVYQQRPAGYTDRVCTKYFFSNPGTNFNHFLITAFTVAGLIGSVVLIIQIAGGRQQFSVKAFYWAGTMIGIPNYFSIWCLGKVIAAYQGNSSAVIPVNNMGIVLFQP